LKSYPRIPHNQQKHTKLTLKQIKEIRSQNKQGKTLKILSKKYKVGVNVIRYWTDEAYRTYQIEKSVEHKRKKLEDPKFRKKFNKQQAEYMRKRLKIPKIKRYNRLQSKRFNANRPEEISTTCWNKWHLKCKRKSRDCVCDCHDKHRSR